MSFMLTTRQVQEETKSHTIRDGWWNLKKGEILNAVKQCQGLKKGEKIVRLKQIRVVSTRESMLIHVTSQLCKMEGFPELTPVEFADMFMKHNRKVSLTKPLNFIRFEYI